MRSKNEEGSINLTSKNYSPRRSRYKNSGRKRLVNVDMFNSRNIFNKAFLIHFLLKKIYTSNTDSTVFSGCLGIWRNFIECVKKTKALFIFMR